MFFVAVVSIRVKSRPEVVEVADPNDSNDIQYPYLEPGDAVDEYMTADGEVVEVADPYRVLEDSESEVTKNWIISKRIWSMSS